MITVSTIIPTFNRASVIANAVNSALGQQGVNQEIIVIDDGSDDSTREVLLPLMDRIRYIHTNNRGVSAARNTGIQEANGEWIAFLDSDDVWHPKKLVLQLECVTETGADICFCSSVDEDRNDLDDLSLMDPELSEKSIKYYAPTDLRILRLRRYPFVQGTLIKRELLLQIGGFDTTLHVAEDIDFIYRITLISGHSVINRKLVTISRRRKVPGLSDAIDIASARRNYECSLRVQSKFFWRLAPLDKKLAAVVRKRILYFVSRLAEVSCASGEKFIAQRYAMEGLDVRADWKSFIRNILILLAYPFMEKIFSSKWKT